MLIYFLQDFYDEIADQIFKLREQREKCTVNTAATDSVKAVQKIHDRTGIIVGNIVIDSRINRSGSKPVWYGKNKEHPVFRRNRKSTQSEYRQKN
jgi:imidazole glycerol phosphate synthase subunit HisF